MKNGVSPLVFLTQGLAPADSNARTPSRESKNTTIERGKTDLLLSHSAIKSHLHRYLRLSTLGNSIL